MAKRLITVVLAVIATLGLAAAPAQAQTLNRDAGTGMVQPLGWDWGL